MLIDEYMNLQLEIKKDNKMILRLVGNGGNTSFSIWRDSNSLSRTLLAKIDKLLRKNRVGVDKISGYKIISDVPENWTSARIAKITFESLGIASLAKKNRLC
jgi:hypothetical protein